MTFSTGLSKHLIVLYCCHCCVSAAQCGPQLLAGTSHKSLVPRHADTQTAALNQLDQHVLTLFEYQQQQQQQQQLCVCAVLVIMVSAAAGGSVVSGLWKEMRSWVRYLMPSK